MVKIVDREKGIKYNQDDEIENRERIRVDLAARINFIEAILQIHPLYTKDYEGKKGISPQAKLQLKIDNIDFIAHQKEKLNWVFNKLNKY